MDKLNTKFCVIVLLLTSSLCLYSASAIPTCADQTQLIGRIAGLEVLRQQNQRALAAEATNNPEFFFAALPRIARLEEEQAIIDKELAELKLSLITRKK